MANKSMMFVLPKLQPPPIFSKASLQKGALSFEQTIKTLFQGIGNGAIPEGIFGAYVAGLVSSPTKETWCRASFLECEMDHQTVYARGNDRLAVTPLENQQLADSFRPFFKEVDLELHVTPQGEWYLAVQRHTDVIMNDMPLLPSGPDQAFWRRLITECQMLLSTHPVNLKRRENRQIELNCLWFEGLGKAAGAMICSYKHVYTDESSLQGLAKWAGVEYSSIAEGFRCHDFPVLVISRTLKHPEQWETQWFNPAYQALIAGKLDEIILDNANGRQLCLKPWHRYYFWRQIKLE